MKKYVCNVCGWIYDPAVGIPEDGIAPGTAFEDLPDDWVCPQCFVGKDVILSNLLPYITWRESYEEIKFKRKCKKRIL